MERQSVSQCCSHLQLLARLLQLLESRSRREQLRLSRQKIGVLILVCDGNVVLVSYEIMFGPMMRNKMYQQHFSARQHPPCLGLLIMSYLMFRSGTSFVRTHISSVSPLLFILAAFATCFQNIPIGRWWSRSMRDLNVVSGHGPSPKTQLLLLLLIMHDSKKLEILLTYGS